MKKMMLTWAMMSLTIAGFAQKEVSALSYAPSPFVSYYSAEIEGTGTIMLKEGTWIIRVKNAEGVTDYIPTNIDVNFKMEGTIVHFKAELQDIPDNVRMIGHPIKIITIERVQ